MQFDNDSVDVSGVDDRRGMGGGGLAIGGGGLGVVGVILYFVFQAISGGSGGSGAGLQLPPGLQAPAQSGQSTSDLQTRCNASGALQRDTDCRLIKVYDVADTVWSAEIPRRGGTYERPRLTFFSGQTQTGCGGANSQVGPFYCPADQRIYLDLDFLEQLQQQFGAQGQFAQAYIVAHEFGHHIQHLTGTERKVRAAQQSNPGKQNDLSVRLELQADCYAGVWSKLADQSGENGIALSSGDVAEAVKAAQAVGDDRIQQKTAGRVNPESWTHGSAAQRASWFQKGLAQGDMADCDSFSGAL